MILSLRGVSLSTSWSLLYNFLNFRNVVWCVSSLWLFLVPSSAFWLKADDSFFYTQLLLSVSCTVQPWQSRICIRSACIVVYSSICVRAYSSATTPVFICPLRTLRSSFLWHFFRRLFVSCTTREGIYIFFLTWIVIIYWMKDRQINLKFARSRIPVESNFILARFSKSFPS